MKKPDIPLITDSVSKLQAIGSQTVAKLRDLTAAAAASPKPFDSVILQDFCAEHNSIRTGMSLPLMLILHHIAVLAYITLQPSQDAADMLVIVLHV